MRILTDKDLAERDAQLRAATLREVTRAMDAKLAEEREILKELDALDREIGEAVLGALSEFADLVRRIK